jgi:thiopurine S-methyltransferase
MNDIDYWIQRWQENRIGFHLAGVNPFLERFLPQTGVTSGDILVPLAGKSVDVAWLANTGFNVVAVDVSEIAARTFVAEQNLEVNVSQEPPFTVFRSDHIRYYVGDFFATTPERIGRFDLIYDRAALIALPPDTRPAYAAKLESLLKPAGQFLTISLEYDPKEMSGPPYAVMEPEIRSLFAAHTIGKLHEYDCLDDEPRFRERGLTWMKEVVYRIR